MASGLAAKVEVLDGPEAGKVVDLPLGARLVVGRADDAGLRLTDPEASRRHCALEHSLAGVAVEDLGSRCGTAVDGKLVAKALVAATADLTVGQTRLRVVRGGAKPKQPTPEVAGVRLDRPLGSGASGEVWAGALEPSGLAVAVKVLALDADAITRQRFEQEVHVAARLAHPAIARVLELRATRDGRPVLLRALAQGESLEAVLERGRLPWRDVARLGVVLADALDHAHGRGVIHRDIKPANIVLGPDGIPVLIDFDLAKRAATDGLTRLTRTGEGLGSLAYVAPEQLSSARDADGRSDVYGLGLTLYHAAGGVQPFSDVDPEDFIHALTTLGPRPLGRLVGDLPAPFVAAVARAHAPRAEQRWAQAKDLGVALQAVLA